MHRLKQGLGAVVDWVTQPEYRDLVRCFEDVDEVILFPRANFLRSVPGYLRELRRRRYDYIVDLQGLLKSAALVGRLARGGERVGPPFRREGTAWFYSISARGGERQAHAVDQLLAVAETLGAPAGPIEFPVSFPRTELSAPTPRVGLIPCSRWPAKNWPVEQFAEVARCLRDRAGASVFLFGARGDEETCSRIEQMAGARLTNLCAKTSLPELGAHLKQMDLVISVDSGPMHMAAACGTPVLALFGITDPRRIGPYGASHRVLTADNFDPEAVARRDYKRPAGEAGWTLSTRRVLDTALQML